MTLFLLWFGTYCISCVVQQTSGVKDLSSLVRYDDSSLAAIRHVQSIIPVVRPRPNIRSHSVLLTYGDQEPLWLLKNVIKDDCQFLGVHMRPSTRCKVWFTLGLFANYFCLKSLSLSLKSHMNVL